VRQAGSEVRRERICVTPTSYVLNEYETRVIDCPPPTLVDRRLTEILAAGGKSASRMDVRWLTEGQMEVTTYSWVGVVRFSAVEIRVVPKLIGGALHVLRMIEYAHGVRLIARLPTNRPLPAEGTDLFDLVVMLLVEETRALTRDGLIRDYRAVEDSLDVVRGRLRIREQYLRRYGRLHRIECAFDEFDGDVPENQLLAAALQAVGTRVRDLDIRNGARLFAGILDDVCTVHTTDADWYARTIHYGRRNVRYQPAHELAKLILTGLALTDQVDKSTVNLTSFMIDMNAIFERFVTRLVADSLASTELRAWPQRTVRAVIIDEESGQTYSTIRPDLIIEDTVTGEAVPIDIKYKLYDAKKFSTADIYQSFVYAYSIHAQAVSPRAGLIYPSTVPIFGPALYIKPLAAAKAARIRGAGLDVPAALDAVNGPDEANLHSQVRSMIREVTDLKEPSDASAIWPGTI
jgi:5-methylcytosine-specific restriction enzyme subunit McrC